MSKKNKETIKKEFNYPKESLCPSCGKFVGPYERCPYCQANIAMRISLRLVRRFVVIGAFLGVAMLWWAAHINEVPVMKIGSIRIENNMALVKIVGKITASKMNVEKNSITYTINDDSGNIKVSAFNQLKKFKKHFGDELPKIGDTVAASGNLSISETWGVSMFLSSAARLEVVEKMVIKQRTIEEITPDDVGNVFKMKLQITGVRKFKSGRGIKVKDDTGTMELIIWDKSFDKLKDADLKDKLIRPGNVFEMKIQVGQYKGKMQLNPAMPIAHDTFKFITYVAVPGWQPDDQANAAFKPAAKPVYKKPSGEWPDIITISQINKSLMYTDVAIKAQIRLIQKFKTGILWEVEDESGSIKVWCSKDAKSPAESYKEKEYVTVLGKVDLFKNNIQLAVTDGSALKKVVAEKNFSAHGNILPIEKVNAGMKGETVTVCGTVTDAKTFKPGTSITIDDGTAKINLWITTNVGKYLDLPAVKTPGTKLQVKGIVSLYEKNVQLTVKNSKNLKIQ